MSEPDYSAALKAQDEHNVIGGFTFQARETEALALSGRKGSGRATPKRVFCRSWQPE